jgi:Na+/melibiose symporter-like transporter
MYAFAQWLQATPVSVAIQSADWVIPLTQSVHILTIAIVFVSILVITLRVLKMMHTDEPYADVIGRFSPWIARGLVVLALTGVTLVVGEPVRELMSLSFWLKMGLLAVAVASTVGVYRTLAPRLMTSAAGERSSLATKSAAIAVIVLWLAIIFLGRAIAYDVEVWGAWSLSPRA